MNLSQLVQSVLDDTVGPSLGAFRPELVLCATILALLLAHMLAPRWRDSAFWIMLTGSAAMFALAVPWQWIGEGTYPPTRAIFTGLLVCDTLAIYLRCLLFFFLLLFTIFTQITGVPHRDDATEFYVLVLGATLGMCLMVSANHMAIVFLGVEMASVPSYVLAGLLRSRPESSEAALKYAVFGAGTAGVMLYGISLLVGVLGSAHLPSMAVQLGVWLAPTQTGKPYPPETMVLVLGGLMVMVGLAFKLSAVPFHFWAPDVFEGATAEVAAFLSVASKAAALGLLLRLALGFAAVTAQDGVPESLAAWIAGTGALEPARQYMAGLIALVAAITCTFGNLAAYGQSNMKRLLAYSTIAHAGYMMMPVAAAVAMAGSDAAGSRSAVAAIAFYVTIYLFMNLGAFAVVAIVRNVLHSEQIDAYAGLIRRSPALALCLSIILFSLVGLPPLAGFAGKFALFSALVQAGSLPMLLLLAVGGLNTALSLFYYLRVVKVMVLSPGPEDAGEPLVPVTSLPGIFCVAITAPVLVLGVLWGGLYSWAQAAAVALLP